MPVRINDIQSTNGSSVSVSIPDGQHDYMLVAFTFSWDSSSTPTRGTPSGGGGSWTAIDDQEVNRYFTPSHDYKLRAYAWYSIPTSRGSVSIDVGTESGEGDFSAVYSISNAEFYEYRSISEIQTVEIYDYAQFEKQGSLTLGTSIGVEHGISSFVTQPMYDAIFDAQEPFTFDDPYGEPPGDYSKGYITVYRTRERGQRLSGGSGQRAVWAGSDWNASPTPYSANILVALNSVECL